MKLFWRQQQTHSCTGKGKDSNSQVSFLGPECYFLLFPIQNYFLTCQMGNSMENLQKGKSWELVVLFPPFGISYLYIQKNSVFSFSGMQLSKTGGGEHCLQVLVTVRGIILKILRANPRTLSFLPSLFLTSKNWWIPTPQIMTQMSLSLEVPSFRVYF